ncbi:hypothetical protein [Bradyrhizobium cenepequi]|uniref:hypothetical protein n=1 Tax=Bradyrhizobium cenepequi TaxID=2821403 RepID=UPI001CE3986F|nr:hypothetical protein [Bradyrhizobium cenepequi]MCA6112704.1 hypothetical protein [Bradyrhizobium cenepequi]
MPALKNLKWERFAQELAKGKTADEVYQLAGYRENRENAVRLKANESIQARVNQLHTRIAERTVEKTAVTREWIINELVKNVAKASQQRRATNDDGEEVGEFKYQGNVVNKALELIARIEGHMVDRKEVGKPGDFADMTDDELDAQIEELISRGKAGVGEGTQATAAMPPPRATTAVIRSR